MREWRHTTFLSENEDLIYEQERFLNKERLIKI